MDNLNAYYQDWSNEALDEHRRAILTEQERRANLAQIPEQIAQLRQTFLDGGGDETELIEALAPKTEEETDAGPQGEE